MGGGRERGRQEEGESARRRRSRRGLVGRGSRAMWVVEEGVVRGTLNEGRGEGRRKRIGKENHSKRQGRGKKTRGMEV